MNPVITCTYGVHVCDSCTADGMCKCKHSTVTGMLVEHNTAQETTPLLLLAINILLELSDNNLGVGCLFFDSDAFALCTKVTHARF